MRMASEPFWGVVTTIDWVPAPNGVQYKGFQGRVSVLDAEAVLGVNPGRGEAQWIAQVEGEADTVWIPGCKVALVAQTRDAGPDIYTVP